MGHGIEGGLRVEIGAGFAGGLDGLQVDQGRD